MLSELASHDSPTFLDRATVALRLPGAVGGWMSPGGGEGVAVGLGVGAGVALGRGVGVAVGVDVGVAVAVGLGVGVGDGVSVGLGVAVGDGETGGVGLGVGVGPPPKEIRTTAPDADVLTVEIETPRVGSVNVRPTARGASTKVVVPGFVSMSCDWERVE